MQSNGLRAVSRQNSNFAVSPETKVVPPTIRRLSRRRILKLCFVLFLLAISGATARVAQGAGTLSFSPSSASLGNVAIGTSHSTTVTIKNSGTASVTISSGAVHGSGFSASGIAIPQTIAPGGSAMLTIKFSPTSSGFSSGYVYIGSNASNAGVEYSVSGTGVNSGILAASVSSVSFGSVPVGSKNSQTVQLKNTGGSTLTVYSAGLLGSGFSVSGLASPLALILSPGQTTSVGLAYAPTTTGSVSGSLTLKSTATNSTLTILLSGTGVSSARAISLSSLNLNFGNEVVGGTSALAVAVKNTGNSSVTITQVNVSGTGYSASGGLAGATIAAGQTAELIVVFAPKVTGSVTGTVSIVSNASNSPNTIPLTGAGVSSTAHAVSLNWAASSSSNVIGYYVYRSTTSGSGYARLTTSVVNALKYTDGAVSAGNTYYYVVTTVTSSGAQSGYSGQVIAIIP